MCGLQATLIWVAVCLGLLHMPMKAHAQQVLVEARTGQALADAILQMGRSGANTTILIVVPYISLRGAVLLNETYLRDNAGVLFQRGKLTVQGLTNGTTTVLDAGMRDLLIPAGNLLVEGGASTFSYEVRDITIINSCESGVAAVPEKTSVAAAAASSLKLFRTNTIRIRSLTNITVYQRQAAIVTTAHQGTCARSVIPELRVILDDFLGATGTVIEPGAVFSLTSQSAGVYDDSTTIIRNFVSKALDDPTDPFLQQLKAQGRIMTPQYCSDGSELPKSFLDQKVDTFLGPFWVAVDQPSLLIALRDSTANYNTRVILNLPRILGLGFNLTAPASGSYPIKDFRYMIVSNTSSDRKVTLDLNQRVGLFDIAAGSTFYVQWMALTGLAAQVPTVLPKSLDTADKSRLLPSVFPLAAFKAANGSESWDVEAPVVMAVSTLTLPPNEYLAFLVLVTNPDLTNLPSWLDPSVSQLAAQLKAGFTKLTSSLTTAAPSLTLEQHVSQTKELLLDAMVGWGVNATNLRLVPSSPVTVTVVSSSGSSKEGLSTGQIIGLAVGITAGVLALAALLAILVRQRRQSGHQSGASSPNNAGSKPGSAVPSAVKSIDSPVGPIPGSNNASVSPGASSLRAGIETAAQSQQRMLNSTQSGSSPGTLRGAKKLGTIDEQAMIDQVENLAAKLQPKGEQLVLVGVLGAGSGGTVYMGQWRGMQVAVKTITFPYLDSNDLPQRAVMETAVSASVGHRNLVATYHYDFKALKTAQGDGQNSTGLTVDIAPSSKQAEHTAYKLFLVQELCTMSLGFAISQGMFGQANVGIDLVAVLSVMVDVASGVEYLHNNNIIHGDLKPENILLKADAACAEGVVAKLTDFGLSAALPAGETHVSNYSAGTPFYVAPEVITNRRLSPASDIYSFGVTLWEMFTLQQPYVKSADGTLVWNPLFPNYLPHMQPSPAAQQLTNRCLQHDPQLRPTAKEATAILQDLHLEQVEYDV